MDSEEYTVISRKESMEDSNGKGGELFRQRGYWLWRTREGKEIAVYDMPDSHLRNAALFLMGMGYSKCIAKQDTRIMWLRVLKAEWDRRIATGQVKQL